MGKELDTNCSARQTCEVGWLQKETPYAYIARFHGVRHDVDNANVICVGNRQLCMQRQGEKLYFFAEEHDADTWSWLLDFARKNPSEKIYSFVNPNNLLSRKGVFFNVEDAYHVYLFNNPMGAEQVLCPLGDFCCRQLTVGDMDALSDLFAQRSDAERIESDKLNLPELISGYHAAMFIENNLVGFVGLFGSNQYDLEIGRFFTSPAHRGKGICRILCTKLIADIKSKNDQRRIYSWTAIKNISAARVLLQSGFRPVGSLCKIDLTMLAGDCDNG